MKYLLLLGMAFATIAISNSVIPDFCNLEPAEGDGQDFIHLIYYNPAKDQCEPFIYSGSGGNANRFEKERECIRNCSANATNIYPIDESLACHFKKAPGHCKNQLMRYYYDPHHDKCKRFQWSGCIGNGNRFFTYESCNRTCDGIHDDGHGDEIEDEETDTPVALICGILLAVIIVAIVTTVIVLTVKSRKKTSKKAGGKRKEPKVDAPLREQPIEMA